MLDNYLKLISGGEGEIIEKKSRFIGNIAPVETEEEAFEFIDRISKKYHDARHNCYAFSLGIDNPVVRYSDNGEPQGTAGKPILEVVQNSGISNICIVVTRYFGGTLLGTGGLVRAYTDASKEALAACSIKNMKKVLPTKFTLGYTEAGKIQYYLNTRGVYIDNAEFTDTVIVTAFLPFEDSKTMIEEITNLVGARVEIETLDSRYA